MIDGGYFIRRIDYFLRKHFSGLTIDAAQLVKIIWRIVRFHLDSPHGRHAELEPLALYRIYYYDCPPLDKQIKFPLPLEGHKTPSTKNFKAHARIKGVDFILDPMHQKVSASLSEHVDGVQSSNIVVAIADICKIQPTHKPEWWEAHVDRRREKRSQRAS